MIILLSVCIVMMLHGGYTSSSPAAGELYLPNTTQLSILLSSVSSAVPNFSFGIDFFVCCFPNLFTRKEIYNRHRSDPFTYFLRNV